MARASRWLAVMGFPSFVGALLGYFIGAELVKTAAFASEVDAHLESWAKMSGARPEPNPRILIVTVDQASKPSFGDSVSDGAVDRRVYANFLALLDAAGASVIVSDIAFTVAKPEQDRKLAASIKGLHKLKVVLTLGEADSQPNPREPDQNEYAFPPSALEAYDLGHNATIAHGLSSKMGELLTGVFPIRTDYGSDRSLLHSALAATTLVQAGDPKDCLLKNDGTRLTCSGLEFELSANQELPIRWSGAKFPTLSLQEAFRQLNGVHPDKFKNRIIVLGDARSSKLDWHVTERLLREPGYEVVANALNTALLPPSQRFWNFPGIADASLAICLSTCVAIIILSKRTAWTGLAAIALALGVLTVPFLLSATLLARTSSVPWIACVAGSSLTAILVALKRGGRTDLRKGGQTQHVTALFCDIVDSTPLAADLGPVGYQALFTELGLGWHKIIQSKGGQIERTLGDGLFAVFANADLSLATSSALECGQALIESTHLIGAQHGKKIAIAVGIEAGVVSGGYVIEGGQRVWSSTGLPIVAAQRIQGLVRQVDTPILLGPTAASLIRHKVQLESKGRFALKGLPETTEVFAVRSNESLSR